MADSSSAELGITVQGRVNVANHTQNTNFGVDAGVYVSTIIPGCAAAYDGRLQVGDQLLSVNAQSLVGKTNDNALETLRKALAQNRPEIQLVRRCCPTAHQACLYIRTCVCMHTLHVRMCTHMYVCTYVYSHVCPSTHTYTTYVHSYMHTYIHTYVHTY